MSVNHRLHIVTSRTIQSIDYKNVFTVYNATNNKKSLLQLAFFVYTHVI